MVYVSWLILKSLGSRVWNFGFEGGARGLGFKEGASGLVFQEERGVERLRIWGVPALRAEARAVRRLPPWCRV